MARPKKKRGFRRIIVDGIEYRWLIRAEMPDTILQIAHGETKGQTLIVQMLDVVSDVALFGNITMLSISTNKQVIITNKFVQQAILFALKNGWEPETAMSDFCITCLNEEFALV